MEKTPSKILVTSGAGYLTSRIIFELLKKNYHVRTTVKSLKKKDKYAHLFSLTSNASQFLEIIEVDLKNEANCIAATKGCDTVFHAASPFPQKTTKDETEIIKLAVQGTLNILNGCVQNGVKKFVLTSSIAAIMLGNENSICTEDDWSSEEGCPAYARSQVLAEKAAWNFYSHNKDKMKFASLCPGLLWGPVLTPNAFFSGEMIQLIMSGQTSTIPNMSYPIVDVRDAAAAHITAMEKSDITNGKRYIIVSECLSLEKVIEYLTKEFSKYGYKFPKLNEAKMFARMIAIFNPMFKLFISAIGTNFEVSNKRSVEELGIHYLPVQTCLLDMVYSMFEKGMIPDKRRPRARL